MFTLPVGISEAKKVESVKEGEKLGCKNQQILDKFEFCFFVLFRILLSVLSRFSFFCEM